MKVALTMIPLLVAATPVFENLETLDERLAQLSEGRVRPLDPRLRLARCPAAPSIAPTMRSGFVVSCGQNGWRLHVPLLRDTPANTAGEVQPLLVQPGGSVQVVIVGESYNVNYQAIAMEAGRLGDVVRIKFLPGNTILAATVAGPGRVSITD